jgi:anti-sigma-K factor RskA
VTPDHDAIDELLAGYVLRALSGPDAAEADRLLAEHVPDCADCQDTLTAFQGITGDLAVSVAPGRVPEMLLPRLHTQLEPRRTRRMPAWGGGRVVAAVAAVVVLVGVAGLAVSSRGGGSDPVLANADLAQIRSVAAQPGAQTTDLGEADEVTAPGIEETYVMGEGVSAPPAGMTYRLWAVGPDGARYLGDFTPVQGIVALEIQIDTATVRLLVTVEPAGSEPGTPGQPAWSAA